MHPSATWLRQGQGDHFKWRLMRASGVPEELITGDGDDYGKLEVCRGAAGGRGRGLLAAIPGEGRLAPTTE